jgi:hypothetical protein
VRQIRASRSCILQQGLATSAPLPVALRTGREQTLLDRHPLQGVFEQRTSRARDLAQVGVQRRLGGVESLALRAVGLEMLELDEDLGQMTRAFAGDGRRKTGEIGKR